MDGHVLDLLGIGESWAKDERPSFRVANCKRRGQPFQANSDAEIRLRASLLDSVCL